MKYAITFDYCANDSDYEEKDIVEEFEGTYDELQAHLKQMRRNGCYNIEANAIGEE